MMKIIEQQKIDVRDFVSREVGENISTLLGRVLSPLNSWLPTWINGASHLAAGEYIRATLLPIAQRLLISEVELLKVEYDSVDPTGLNSAKLTGLVIIPQRNSHNTAMNPAMPLIGFQHGTELLREGAPSRFSKENPLQTIEALIGVLLAANSGSIIAMADYQGLGGDDDHIQPYIGAKPLAMSVLDLLLATKEHVQAKQDLCWSEEVFLAGYSQGGFVTIAVAQELENNNKYADELPLKAVAPCSGPYSLADTMRFLMLREETFKEGGYFIPMAIRGFNAQYGDSFANGLFTKERAFKPEFQGLWDLVDGHHTPEEVNALMPDIPRHCLSEELLAQLGDPESQGFKALLENEVLNWQPQVPVHLYSSPNDETVPFDNSIRAFEAMKQHSNDVALVPTFSIPFGTLVHIEAYIPTILTANTWLTTMRKAPHGTIEPGEFIQPGNEVFSPQGKYCLRYQFDGELKQYDMSNISVKFSANIDSIQHLPDLAVNQAMDGNFVVYDRTNEAKWASDTWGKGQNRVVLKDNGDLTIIDMQGKVVKLLT
jgi:hypothetical protein